MVLLYFQFFCRCCCCCCYFCSSVPTIPFRLQHVVAVVCSVFFWVFYKITFIYIFWPNGHVIIIVGSLLKAPKTTSTSNSNSNNSKSHHKHLLALRMPCSLYPIWTKVHPSLGSRICLNQSKKKTSKVVEEKKEDIIKRYSNHHTERQAMEILKLVVEVLLVVVPGLDSGPFNCSDLDSVLLLLLLWCNGGSQSHLAKLKLRFFRLGVWVCRGCFEIFCRL